MEILFYIFFFFFFFFFLLLLLLLLLLSAVWNQQQYKNIIDAITITIDNIFIIENLKCIWIILFESEICSNYNSNLQTLFWLYDRSHNHFFLLSVFNCWCFCLFFNVWLNRTVLKLYHHLEVAEQKISELQMLAGKICYYLLLHIFSWNN